MPIQSVNDFVVRFANVNGSGSASANELFARSTRSRLQWRMKASASEEDGVIGYQAHTVAPP